MRSGLQPVEIAAREFRLQGYERLEASRERLALFIEGDGSPWIQGGREVAADPTPRNPIVLRMAASTPASVLYLGRPCYFAHVHEAGCSAALWTSARYSQQVVASMADAIDGYVARNGFQHVTLIGHSGGGTLAVLIAPRLRTPCDVVTLAANLDIAAWARLHDYTPLFESLNPSDEPPLPASIRELHFAGGRDVDVPPASAERYLHRLGAAQVRIVPGYDHFCCWERDWPQLWADIQRDSGVDASASEH